MVNSRVLYLLAHSLIGLGFSYIHIFHVQKLFESNYKFSHLSNLERELSLSSKEAFYYSFYKRIIDADTFEAGIERLVNDNLTEFNENTSINSLQKFHILPEVLIGCLYKNFITLTQRFKLPTVVCFTVERDDPKLEHEILSCEGYGEPIYFYLSVVWSLSGITVFLLYMYGYFLHRNLIAGCVVIVYYFCMHESATNIHRQPMSRQNFALPFIIWQTFYLNLYIDKHHFVRRSSGINPRNYAMVFNLILFTTTANLCWDMSQYIFLTQTIAIFLLLQLNDKSGQPYVSTGLVLDYAISQILSNVLSYLLMYGNSSFLVSSNMSINAGLVLYLFPMKITQPHNEDDFPNIRGPIKKFIYHTFMFFSLSIFVQDVTDRFLPITAESTSRYYVDFLLVKMGLKIPNLITLLAFYQPQDDLLNLETMKLYNIMFVFKNLSLFIVIKLFHILQKRREKINEDTHEMIERAKNYLIEDFLEENRITMKDLTEAKTEKQIADSLKLLKKCNYDYEIYKEEKKLLKTDKAHEKMNFLNDIKKLKTEAQDRDRKKKVSSDEKTDESPKNKSLEVGEDNEDNEEKEVPEEKKEEEEEVKAPQPVDNKEEHNIRDDFDIQPYYLFCIIQTFLLSFTALKFVLTPFLCLLASTLPSRSWFSKSSSMYWIIYIFLIVCTFNYPGIKNIQEQYHQKGEFNNPELENLINWIDKTEPTAVFGAPMEVSAHILLTTQRPIVNHPLIGFVDMAERTRNIYSVFSKKTSTEIYNLLVKLRVQYVVIPYESCYLASKHGIRLLDIYDFIEPENYNNLPFCVSLFQKTNPTFLKVYENFKYIVIQIFSQSIQLELKKNNIQEYQM